MPRTGRASWRTVTDIEPTYRPSDLLGGAAVCCKADSTTTLRAAKSAAEPSVADKKRTFETPVDKTVCADDGDRVNRC